jgi:hypothetical protein
MSAQYSTRIFKSLVVPFAAALSVLTVALAGCANGIGMGGSGTGSTPSPAVHVSGVLHGGQQPVNGSQVYLYAAGTASDGSASRSMLVVPGFVLSGTDGSFSITGKYTCQAGDQVYVLALGGDAGGGPNSAIAMMAALGPCSALTSNTFISVNEVTTVAAVYALAPFMTGPTNVGALPANANALAAAFASSRNMVDTTTGVAPAVSAVGSGIVPQAAINSLANSLAACINSASGGGSCSTLFTDATVSGSTPDNTVQATLNVAKNPTQNATNIYNLGSPQSPFQPSLQSAPASFALSVAFPSDVLTYFNNATRTGVQSSETILTPANVNSASFGKRFTFSVDGYLYAQPLYAGGLGMPDGAVHDVVIASSVHGTVYAFDADGNNPAQGYLWKTSVVPTGETQVTTTDYGCPNPDPETTLLSSPVIDRSTGTLYAVSKTKNTVSGAFIQRLHAISLLDGSEKFGGPVNITASIPSTSGDGQVGNVLTFDALKENQRSALLLANGTVWIAWASHCDIGPYHGWVMGYNASTLAQSAVYNNTPNGSDGGIWMAAGGPAADAQGSIYVIGGNGTFNPPTNDLGDAGIKLTPPTAGLTPTVADYFVPSNQLALSNADLDVGVSQPVLFSDPASGVAPNLMVETDKTGRIYLLNTADMGTYDTGTNGPDSLNGDLQDFTIGGNIFNNFAYFNGNLYVGGSGLPLRTYTFTPGSSTTAGSFSTTPGTQTTFNMPGGGSSGGAGPNISANGSMNGIAWATTHSGSNVILYAFDASNLATELYGSDQATGSRDLGPVPVKFTSAVVANGHVFVGGQGALVVYGLLP